MNCKVAQSRHLLQILSVRCLTFQPCPWGAAVTPHLAESKMSSPGVRKQRGFAIIFTSLCTEGTLGIEHWASAWTDVHVMQRSPILSGTRAEKV